MDTQSDVLNIGRTSVPTLIVCVWGEGTVGKDLLKFKVVLSKIKELITGKGIYA